MKKMIYFLFALLWLSATNMNAQVAIGTDPALTPRPGTILDLRHVSGNNLGLLLPKVTLTSATLWAPVVGTDDERVEGMMVFNESTSTKNGLAGKGVYIWVNGSWNIMGDPVEDPCSKPEASFTQGNPTGATVCQGLKTTLSLEPAIGGLGAITYNWQKSPNGNDGSWVDADEPRNDHDYTTPATLTSDTYYKRQAISEKCGMIESESAKVEVISFTQANPPANMTVCYGGSTTITLEPATGGTGTLTYNWQQSSDNITWGNATGTRNTANYTTPTLFVKMYYRRVARRTTCGGSITSSCTEVSISQTTGTVTSAGSGLTYKTYSYPNNLGTWTENIREYDWATWAYYDNTNKTGERGYYYRSSNAPYACGSLGGGFYLPTRAQWAALFDYLKSEDGGSDGVLFFSCGAALAGQTSVDNHAPYGWDMVGEWWHSGTIGASFWYSTSTGFGETERPYGSEQARSVRCVKSNN